MNVWEHFATPHTGGEAKDIGAQTVAAVRDAMAKAGLNASGDTSASLNYTQSAFSLEIYAEGRHAPFFTLQNSVTPTPRGGPGFFNEILQWTKDKGLTPTVGAGEDPEKARERMARAIYSKIWQDGTRRAYPPRKDIYTPALESAVAAMADQVAGVLITDYILKK